MYVITVSLSVKEMHHTEFLREMLLNARQSRDLEPGCRRFDVAASVDDTCSVFLYELYESEADFEAHLRMEHYHRFDEATRDWITSKVVNRFHLCD
ncbi:antibiotic biosynthesis monooxygenase [Paraburkholderia sp. Cy-641]|uniref:putative quinol monooxygenase n=1 Tax=Paraburkholderia sp. Cy-641 TaxID=2608337 RepID=UPI00141E1912|nr:putative quinol monooxygenase [Paraburkholderia sp. Cy-641]NIF79598.1 antibiotic biosynthesis monooxygenase [Paraburkholderia sp. Cy-641]